MSVGLQLISTIVRDGSRSTMAEITPQLFVNDETRAYHFMREHYREHGNIPNVETFREHGITFPPAPENVDYYLDRLRRRARYNILVEFQASLNEAVRQRRSEDAADIMREILSRTSGIMAQSDLISLADLGDRMLEEFETRRFISGLQGVTYGWPYLDQITGGLENGDLTVVAARPNLGKSYTLLKMAHEAWLSGRSVLFVSMEMKLIPLTRRLVGIHTGINPELIRRAQLSTHAVQTVRETVASFRDGERPPFNLVAGDFKKTVGDIDAIIQQYNPDVVYIDAGYLLQPESRAGKKDRRELISEVIQELKSVAMRRNRPIVVSVQLNRTIKRKQKGDVDVGQIAETDVIGQIASVIIALQESENQDFANARRKLTIIKNREGSVYDSFEINFTFSPVNMAQLDGEGAMVADNQWEI